MSVKEAIEKLKNLPQDASIEDEETGLDLVKIEHVSGTNPPIVRLTLGEGDEDGEG